jgi:hypothetical protein
MSEIQGNEARTGRANPSDEDKAKSAEKQIVRDAKAEAKVCSNAIKAFTTGVKAAENALDKLPMLLADTRTITLDNGVVLEPWRTQVDKDGKAFTTWHAWSATVLAEYPRMDKFLSRQLAEKMIQEGFSVKATEKASKLSRGTVSNVKAEAEGRKPRPGAASKTEGTAQTSGQATANAVKQVLNANKRFIDLIADVSEEDFVKVSADMTQVANKIRETRKIREEIARLKRVEQQQVADNAGKPAPTPAPTAADKASA